MKRILALYDDWAPTYDRDPNPTRDLKDQVLARRLDGISCDLAIEAGCGSGLQTLRLVRCCKHVHALDFSSGMLEQARRRVTEGHVRFLQADLRRAWPLDEPADLILAALVLEHIEDCGSFLREASRLLKEEGLLLLCEYHPARTSEGRQARFEKNGELRRIPSWSHSEERLVEWADEAGLGLVYRTDHYGAGSRPEVPRLLELQFRHKSA